MEEEKKLGKGDRKKEGKKRRKKEIVLKARETGESRRAGTARTT